MTAWLWPLGSSCLYLGLGLHAPVLPIVIGLLPRCLDSFFVLMVPDCPVWAPIHALLDLSFGGYCQAG